MLITRWNEASKALPALKSNYLGHWPIDWAEATRFLPPPSQHPNQYLHHLIEKMVSKSFAHSFTSNTINLQCLRMAYHRLMWRRHTAEPALCWNPPSQSRLHLAPWAAVKAPGRHRHKICQRDSLPVLHWNHTLFHRESATVCQAPHSRCSICLQQWWPCLIRRHLMSKKCDNEISEIL